MRSGDGIRNPRNGFTTINKISYCFNGKFLLVSFPMFVISITYFAAPFKLYLDPIRTVFATKLASKLVAKVVCSMFYTERSLKSKHLMYYNSM